MFPEVGRRTGSLIRVISRGSRNSSGASAINASRSYEAQRQSESETETETDIETDIKGRRDGY
jgi:excinuclease UvrABC helicase subunit UvrB